MVAFGDGRANNALGKRKDCANKASAANGCKM